MKTGIDVRSTLKRKTGIGYYTLNLINHLAKIDPHTEYCLYSYRKPFALKRKLPRLPGANFSHRVDRFKFRPEIKMRDVDIFHTSSYDMPRFKSAKLVTTIHDIIPLMRADDYPADVLEDLKNKLLKALANSALIIADSESTKNDLERVFAPKTAIKVIYPGKDEFFSPIEDKREAAGYLKNKYGIDKEFILFVGTVERRKNVTGLIDAFLRLKKNDKIPHLLVIAGMKGRGGEAACGPAGQPGLKGGVVFTDYITRHDLRLFYNLADLFVYPSLYEGFGFPIVEAFGCGAPVVTSATSSCGEIAGGAAITVENPDNNDELKEAMLKVLSDRGLRGSLIRSGLERAKAFSWPKAASEFLKIFNSIKDNYEK